MAWIQPKTDWVATDYFNAEDYNRIKNNIAYLKNFTDDLFVGLKWITGKNLVKVTAQSKTENNVNIKINDNGSVTVNTNGATANTFLNLGFVTLSIGEYYLDAGLVATATSRLQVVDNATTQAIATTGYNKSVSFTLDSEKTCAIQLRIGSGDIINNLTFYPMVRKAEIADDAYEPHYDVIPNSTQDLITIGADKEVLSLLYAREINNIETNLETINGKTYKLDIGDKVTYHANKPTPLYEEYNRIESAILRLYETLTVHKANLPRLALTLGQKGLQV